MSVSGGCCVVVGGGGGGRGAKPRVGRCALGVGRCVFRGYCQDFTKTAHFRPSEKLENNFRQHVVLLEYLPTRYCSLNSSLYQTKPKTTRLQKRVSRWGVVLMASTMLHEKCCNTVLQIGAPKVSRFGKKAQPAPL